MKPIAAKGWAHYTRIIRICCRRKVLQISTGVDDVGTIKWDLALCLLLGWIVVYLCIWKGIKSSGKVITSPTPHALRMRTRRRRCDVATHSVERTLLSVVVKRSATGNMRLSVSLRSRVGRCSLGHSMSCDVCKRPMESFLSLWVTWLPTVFHNKCTEALNHTSVMLQVQDRPSPPSIRSEMQPRSNTVRGPSRSRRMTSRGVRLTSRKVLYFQTVSCWETGLRFFE